MHGFNSQAINQHGQISLSGLRRSQYDQMAHGLGGSTSDVVSSQGIVGVPQFPEECWAIVSDYTGNKHAWDEADVANPDDVKVMNGGRRGTIDTDGSGSGGGQDDQPAYDYNGNSYEPGTVIRIRRDSVRHWGIIGGTGSGSGSGTGQYSFDCDTGLITRV